MKLDDLHIGVSPLTDRIYVGTVSKRSPGVWASKADCTTRFLAALMEWSPPGTVRVFGDSQGNRFEIEVRKRRGVPAEGMGLEAIGKEAK
jgi:hypothetical protein